MIAPQILLPALILLAALHYGSAMSRRAPCGVTRKSSRAVSPPFRSRFSSAWAGHGLRGLLVLDVPMATRVIYDWALPCGAGLAGAVGRW